MKKLITSFVLLTTLLGPAAASALVIDVGYHGHVFLNGLIWNDGSGWDGIIRRADRPTSGSMSIDTAGAVGGCAPPCLFGGDFINSSDGPGLDIVFGNRGITAILNTTVYDTPWFGDILAVQAIVTRIGIGQIARDIRNDRAWYEGDHLGLGLHALVGEKNGHVGALFEVFKIKELHFAAVPEPGILGLLGLGLLGLAFARRTPRS